MINNDNEFAVCYEFGRHRSPHFVFVSRALLCWVDIGRICVSFCCILYATGAPSARLVDVSLKIARTIILLLLLRMQS